MNISFKSSYYSFIKIEKVKTAEVCYKFINWLTMEYDLYQMDELEGLKVYYPNGWFTVELMTNFKFQTNILINVKCKSLHKVKMQIAQIETLFNQFNQIFIKKELLN